GSMVKTLDITAGTTVKAEFPVRAMRSISGQVWIDRNHSGAWDSGDVPAAGIWVHLSDGSVARTDETGAYLFRDLAPGRYRAWVRDGARDRTVRLSIEPEELVHVDLFVDQDVYDTPAPDA